MTKVAPNRVLIIDDHPLLRQGIATLINSEKDFTVCAQIHDPRQAIDVIRKNDPQIIILDLSLQGSSGIEVLKDIKAQFPKVRVLIFSMHDETVYAPRALRAGAMGYLMKQEPPEKIIAALRQVMRDQVYLSEQMASRLLNAFTGKRDSLGSPVEVLSDRELEVFSLIGNGNSTRGISEKLKLSVKTIESHRAHIKEKLNLESATQLVQHAIQWVNAESMASAPAVSKAASLPAVLSLR
jgi:DNA-binding NarL/FixJ family response regulator